MLHSVAVLHPSRERLITLSADSASASDARASKASPLSSAPSAFAFSSSFLARARHAATSRSARLRTRAICRPPVIAYNIRFSRALGVIRDALARCLIGNVHVVHAVVGQDLAQWRPGRELAETVSASQKNGGGVLRELSHELD